MVAKHILLADPNAETLEELREAVGPLWELTRVDTGAAALHELKKQPYQILMLSFYLPDVQTTQLLNRVRSKHPQTIRIVVAAEKDRDRVVKEALGAHQLVIKPFNADELRMTLDRAVGSEVWCSNDNLHKLVARMRALPTVPAAYLEIVAALKSPDTSIETVGALISKDMAITTKLLQVINSAYFGLPRTVTNPEEAVGLLGFETVKVMVMTIKLLSQYDRLKVGTFSIERLWEHSTAVAHTARRLVLLQTGDRAMAENAYAAGLLHDVGKAVLAGNFAEQYAGVESLARKRQISVWEVEKEIFGASHGEVGAHLVGLWGLPLEVLEATALHHQPLGTPNKDFSVLTAVHLANVLQHAASAHLDGFVVEKIDMDYLEEIQMVQCLPGWCKEILGPEGSNDCLAPEVEKEAASVPHSALASTPPPLPALGTAEGKASDRPEVGSLPQNQRQSESSLNDSDAHVCESPGAQAAIGNEGVPSGDRQEESFPAIQFEERSMAELNPTIEISRSPYQSDSSSRSRKGLLIGAVIVAAILLVVALVCGQRSQSPQQSLDVAAHPLNSAPDASVASTEANGEKTSAPIGSTTSASGLGANTTIETPNSRDTAATSQSTNDALAETVAAAEPKFPELKLQGILFSPRRPAAIINGAMVHANDVLLGVRIVEVRSSSVTVQFQNRREILSLE